MTLARQAARKAVKAELRAQGFKVQYFYARQISQMADDYLEQHSAELIAEAKARIERSPLFARWRCANLSSAAQPPQA
jgi:hypothetical protein